MLAILQPFTGWIMGALAGVIVALFVQIHGLPLIGGGLLGQIEDLEREKAVLVDEKATLQTNLSAMTGNRDSLLEAIRLRDQHVAFWKKAAEESAANAIAAADAVLADAEPRRREIIESDIVGPQSMNGFIGGVFAP